MKGEHNRKQKEEQKKKIGSGFPTHLCWTIWSLLTPFLKLSKLAVALIPFKVNEYSNKGREEVNEAGRLRSERLRERLYKEEHGRALDGKKEQWEEDSESKGMWELIEVIN